MIIVADLGPESICWYSSDMYAWRPGTSEIASTSAKFEPRKQMHSAHLQFDSLIHRFYPPFFGASPVEVASPKDHAAFILYEYLHPILSSMVLRECFPCLLGPKII